MELEFNVITIFPEMFQALNASITGKALAEGLIKLKLWNPRDYTHDKQNTVDDRPYGGGPGMVMKPQPLIDVIEAAQANANSACKVIHLTPEGQPLNQDKLQRLSQENNLILLAGRYEGIDERVVELAVDEQYSMGDFVLTGGEIPAMALIDGITRLLPGALGDEQSALQDSFQNGLLDCPHFTRPQTYRNLTIPDILLSGDHQAINNWRHKKSLQRTWQKRPDLLKNRHLSAKERQWLDEFQQRGQNDEQNN